MNISNMFRLNLIKKHRTPNAQGEQLIINREQADKGPIYDPRIVQVILAQY